MKTPIKSVEEERKDCEQAFKSCPDAIFAWTCYPTFLVDPMTKHPTQRIKDIINVHV